MHGVKRERIIRVLMNEPGGTLTKYRISKQSGCSIAWTMEYLKNLERIGLVRRTKVLSVRAMYDHWASISEVPARYDFFVQSPRKFLEETGLEYAVTTYQGENLLNNYLFVSRVDAYVRSDDIQKWKSQIFGNGLAGKGNLRLMVADEHVFYKKQKVKGTWLASLPQVLLDLRREGGVCLEAYEMMVKKHVRKKHN